MKRKAFILVLLVSLTAFQVARADGNYNRKPEGEKAPAFTRVIDDLPLMPGLDIVQDDDVLFITRSGRIAETVATGSIDVDDVYHFYQNCLPELGWLAVDGRTFDRENERLRIDVSGVNPKAITIVRFSVKPITAN